MLLTKLFDLRILFICVFDTVGHFPDCLDGATTLASSAHIAHVCNIIKLIVKILQLRMQLLKLGNLTLERFHDWNLLCDHVHLFLLIRNLFYFWFNFCAFMF